MKHSVTFNNCENHWDNALPFGNGVLGCMLFYENKKLYMPMNHYEIYYTTRNDSIPKNRQPEELCGGELFPKAPGEMHSEYLSRAEANKPPEGEMFCQYKADRSRAFLKKDYGIRKFSNAYLSAGELVFSFSDVLDAAQQKLALHLEDAKGVLTLQNKHSNISIETTVLREDCILNTVSQTDAGLLKSLTISFPVYRDSCNLEVHYDLIDTKTIRYTVKCLFSDRKPFTYAGVLRFTDAEIDLRKTSGNDAEIFITRSETCFSILTGIFSEHKYETPSESALIEIQAFADNIAMLVNEHREYWTNFFERSSISIPDKFLEKIYCINQYALDCSSGKDGIMKHNACGLNGLWAVRHPNLWGSMWYWDVNIQAAFAGVFSSNRLELARVFSDGFLSYKKLAEEFAHNIHNLKGCASDFPHPFYYSCCSWCAQYLWYLYEYSLDTEYLKKEAYPIFLELCEFTLGIFEYDEKSDTYTVYPDISPEQGPLAHNTTITVACAKYLLKFTLEAARILEDHSELLTKCEKLLNKLPKYSFSEPGKYGVHFKDSQDAPDNLWIRHPSMLMPVFPIGEFDLSSDENIKQIISNTIDFLEDNCEIGIFGCSWIAAAAARIGRGQTALRILYEKGIDHMLRSNGLTAEATDRFMNYCLIARQPLYYPCMMEFSGEMLSAVNEMLMQSQNNLIRIFPAIPDGAPEYAKALRNGYSISHYSDFFVSYPAWKNVSFKKLLAKGAFEVSARMKNGKIVYVRVLSKKGGILNLTSEFFDTISVFCDDKEVDFSLDNNVYSVETIAGKEYIFASSSIISNDGENGYYDDGVVSHFASTRRNIYIGEDIEAVYRKKVDYFLRDWYYGNAHMANHTVYKFDFTENNKKDYEDAVPRQVITNQGGMAMSGMSFECIGTEEFKPAVGYGFGNNSGIRIVKRQGADVLRCDFAEGERNAEFIIEAPRGQYELLVISGDYDEDSVTIVQGENSRKIGGCVVPKGTFQCEIIPIINERDEPIKINISSLPGYRWKINSLMMNAVKGY